MSDFMPTGPPSDEQVERAMRVAREQGWLTDDGFIWDCPGCQMCGAADGEPCDCHDPQA